MGNEPLPLKWCRWSEVKIMFRNTFDAFRFWPARLGKSLRNTPLDVDAFGFLRERRQQAPERYSLLRPYSKSRIVYVMSKRHRSE
jgi:hypothetical protein